MNPLVPWLVWIFPLAGAVLIPLAAKLSHRVRDAVAVGFPFLAAVAASAMVPEALAGYSADIQVDWIPSLGVKAGVLVDPLSVLMANVVAWISFLIAVYSIGYMRGDPTVTRYWFFIDYFIGNMLLLVMSDNLLQLLFGWEGVGLCSYALIGHWYRDEPERWVGSAGHETWKVPMAYSPSHAGLKAFVMTRIGDIGLLIAVFIIYSQAGTFNFVELSKNVSWAAPLARAGLLLPTGLLFFWGPVGKSAQIPLHEWLPDAMAGPTPVSALIHAATMVKAGVFLVARGGPMFYNALIAQGQSFAFFEVVAWVGALTAFMAATQAIVAKELKKTLAYSTASQIGYMMLAIGVGGLAAQFVVGYTAGLFHLMNHAIFKAAAFMAAGAIIHACETRFMDEMGGIRAEMRLTFLSMMVAMLALSGVPPLSGFWSKDAILAAALGSGQYLLYAIAAATAALTFIYSLKVTGWVFLGKKSEHLHHLTSEGKEVHEAPLIMLVPYLLLALATVSIGLAGPLIEGTLEHFLAGSGIVAALRAPAIPTSEAASAPLEFLPLATTLLMLLAGGTVGYYLYVSRKVDAQRLLAENSALRGAFNFLWNRWYINPAYYRIFVNGFTSLSRSAWRWIESAFFDRTSGAVAELAVGFSGISDTVDVHVVDGAVNDVKDLGVRFSNTVRRIQTGIPQQYVFVFALGIIFLVFFVVFMP